LNRQGRQERNRRLTQIPDNWPQRCTRFTRFFRTHAALTGICRSGRSVDTLIRELIRVSGCPAIHVRIADSAACHSNPTNFLFFCRFLFLCFLCLFVAKFSSCALPAFLWLIFLISVHLRHLRFHPSVFSAPPCETLPLVLSVPLCG
jgi:hypothetical protein